MDDLDEFAKAAMQGFCANNAVFAHNPMCGWGLVNIKEDQLIDYCFNLAEAMLAESKRRKNESRD